MALQPPDDLIELPPEVMALPPPPPPIGFGPPDDLVDPPTVPYGGGISPDQNATLNAQQKNFLNTTAVGRVMNAFGQGLHETFEGDWGIQPKDMQKLREEGVFFRPEQQMTNPLGLAFQGFAESVVAPSVKAMDFALRLGLSPLVGGARALGQASEETGLAAMLGYRPEGANVAVSNDIIGAIDTLGLIVPLHIPQAPAPLVTRRERIAGRERVMASQVPGPATKIAEPPAVPREAFPEPDVVPRAPGAVAATEVPDLPARITEPATPSLQIGEQRVSFPDENHAALFEYGEALAHGERPGVADDLASQFGQQGAANIDSVAQAYYVRVATKIEATSGEVAAGRVDEPGPATFRTTPAGIAQEHALEVAQLEREAAELAVRPKGYGDDNLLVKTSEADEARALLNSSVQRLTAGVDPEAVLAGVKLALYHIEAGVRDFAAWSKQMVSDLGEWARPHLRDWYDRATSAIAEFAMSEAGGGPSRLPRSVRIRRSEYQEVHGSKAGNINLENIDGDADVFQLIREQAARNDDFREQRRGVMTFEDTINLANSAGLDPRLIARRGIGKALNGEEATALRDYFVASSVKVQELARKAKYGTDEDKLRYLEAEDRHAFIQGSVAGAAAEAGRALNAHKILAQATDKAKAIADLIGSKGGRDELDARLDAIIRLNDPDEISRTIHNLRKATTMDMIVEAWMNGLLSGPLTHATNFISNTITNIANIAEMGTAAAIGATREAVGLGGRERVFAGEVGERVFAAINSAQEAVIAAQRAFADDMAASEATGKLDVRRPNAIPSVKVNIPGLGEREIGGKQIRIPSRLLSASDAFFQAISKRQETSALAYRKAMQEGLTGEQFSQRVAQLIADPTKEMMAEVSKSQSYLTFTKPLGPQGRKIQSALNHYPAVKFLVPFLRTPTNIIKFAGERTVLSSFSKEVRANLSGRNGQVAQDTQLARLILGSAITVSALYWASSGLITGGGPADPRARALLYATGWQPYSVKVGDSYHSYLRALGSYGILLGVSADAAEIADRWDAAESAEIGKLAFASATTNLLNQTWLQGPADLALALTQPERYGESYTQGMFSTLVPSVLAQEARVSDPYLREARTFIDRAKARIPGLSNDLLPRRDIWGEPIRREGALGPDRLSPIYITAIKNDFISREMLRLGVWKSQPARSIRGVELTDPQYDRFQQISGRLTRQSLSMVVGRPGWDQIPAYAQANLINRMFDRARESARSQMMISDPDLLSKIIQTGVAEVVSEPESAGLIKYPPMPETVQ